MSVSVLHVVFLGIEYGVYINDAGCDFTSMIFDRVKTVETRDTNVLGRFKDQWVGIIRTGTPGRNGLVGAMKLGQPFKYMTPNQFGRDSDRHWVPSFSRFYMKHDCTKPKWGYPILEVIRTPLHVLPPTTAKGPRPWRKLPV